ncbi:hypothetical protein AVEN_207270-1 [Araneus ventricosus]|uniref:Uncharacterized protein n=1 Tax=Araneus ventricosus TaxID=182803 RepID=A0A4Y2IEE1_ARAVE|nr:hypothetical protein AVEN_207270-1 [Araneus ventricosus]
MLHIALTSKVPDSKHLEISSEDPSCVEQVHVNLTSKDSRFETYFIRSDLVLSQVSQIRNLISSEIRLVLSSGHVKSDVGFQIRNLISSEILLVIVQVHVKSRRREGSRFDRFHQRSVLCCVQYMLNLSRSFQIQKPDFIRDPVCVEPGAMSNLNVEGSILKPEFHQRSLIWLPGTCSNLSPKVLRFRNLIMQTSFVFRVHVKSASEGSRFET